MIRTVRSRVVAVVVTVAAALGGLVLAAPTAQAAPSDCTSYLADLGYSSTDTNLACAVGGTGLPLDSLLCRLLLSNVSSVPPALAQNACSLAKT
ncbi:hypothetical protein [Streptomyces sp. AK02-01A]|uniref:hypothetical protein n=1 Tax=Streptomyces sp. AK02-01A TaxID=3028648 RepID=UPI0029BAEF7A|nr:hypothetical protein [Streptomyces sp. AK02-01A]MDX3852747.1 hypothetical protein [Streptomyces sp. AK02-01A]